MKKAAPKSERDRYDPVGLPESYPAGDETESGDEKAETDAAEPDATAPAPTPAPKKRISGEDLKNKLREERRVARKKEKGY